CVAPVPATNAAPVMNESVAILLLAGNAPKLNEALEIVQAFPARTWRLEVFAPVQAGAEIIAGAFPILFHLLGHPEVAVFAGEAMDHRQAGENRHVHFSIARVKYTTAGIEIGLTDKIGRLARGGQRGRIARVLVPERERGESMV